MMNPLTLMSAFLSGKFAFYAVASAAAAFATWWVLGSTYDRGYNAAIRIIVHQDKEAADESSEARDDFDHCLDGGGMWDFSAGKCDR